MAATAAERELPPGPCSERQAMYMFPEKYCHNKDGTLFGEQVDVMLFGGAAGCFDADTEFRTTTGWKKISEYQPGDLVGQWSKEEGVTLVAPQEYIKTPCEGFNHIQARGLDFCLSPEHRVPYFDDYNRVDPKVISYAEMLSRHAKSKTKGFSGRIKTTFDVNFPGISLTEGEIRLQVAVMADGRVVKEGKNNYTQMRFAKKRKYDRLLALCEKFNLPYKDKGWKPSDRYSTGKEYEVIVWPARPDKKYTGDWWNLSSEQLAYVVDEVRYWDSSVVSNNSTDTVRFSTKHECDADFIQWAFHSQGYNTSISCRRNGSEYTVNATLSGKGFRGFANKDGKIPVEWYPSKDGYKYCFRVPSSFLVVRRNKKVFITGNSGKSEIGVIDFLKWTDIPNFIGVMTRRTTPQLQGPGGLLTKCKRIFSKAYKPDEYAWRAKDGKFVFFKSGAEIYLKHFETEASADNWQGAEANLYYVDEGTQYTQYMIQYIMGRMRNPACPQVKPHLKITCNPSNEHFFLDWVKPYLLEDGTPDRTKDGLVRYFSFCDGKFVWGDTKEELCRAYDVEEEDALSFTFISANVRDNPVVQEINPRYVSWLKGLRGVERARLLDGNWFVKEKASSYFDRNWLEETVALPDMADTTAVVRVFDFAGTLKSDLNPSPDYTASLRMSKTRNKDYIIEDVVRTRILAGQWKDFILECAASDPPGTLYYLPVDPNPAAAHASKLLARELAEKGLYVKTIRASGHKLDRFRPFASMAQNGGVKILSNCARDLENKIENDNSFFYRELENFTGERKRGENGHDDLVDVSSDAFSVLASSVAIPNYLPSALNSSFRTTNPLLTVNGG